MANIQEPTNLVVRAIFFGKIETSIAQTHKNCAARQPSRADLKMTENRYQKLMHYVCVDHGYCGSIVNGKPLHVDDFIPDIGQVSAQQFAEWVLLADGCGPSSSPQFRERHKNDMITAFSKYMGAEAVDARELKLDAER